MFIALLCRSGLIIHESRYGSMIARSYEVTSASEYADDSQRSKCLDQEYKAAQ